MDGRRGRRLNRLSPENEDLHPISLHTYLLTGQGRPGIRGSTLRREQDCRKISTVFYLYSTAPLGKVSTPETSVLGTKTSALQTQGHGRVKTGGTWSYSSRGWRVTFDSLTIVLTVSSVTCRNRHFTPIINDAGPTPIRHKRGINKPYVM